MQLCITLVEHSLLHWCSPTVLDKWPVTEGRDGSHGEGVDTTIPVCIFRITGEIRSCSHPHHLFMSF